MGAMFGLMVVFIKAILKTTWSNLFCYLEMVKAV
jgi:hypothetical protein